jgi:hypothetical protein
MCREKIENLPKKTCIGWLEFLKCRCLRSDMKLKLKLSSLNFSLFFLEEIGRFSEWFLQKKFIISESLNIILENCTYRLWIFIRAIDSIQSPSIKLSGSVSYEILKFCEEMSWRVQTSEPKLKRKNINFLFSLVPNFIREDQFPLLDLGHLHL